MCRARRAADAQLPRKLPSPDAEFTIRFVFGIRASSRLIDVLAGSGEQLVQVRGADRFDQVPLDPSLARAFAPGMLTVSRQGNES